MDGWSEPERDEKGPVRWTISRAAHLGLPLGCSGPLLLRVVAAYAVSARNLDQLQLSVDGHPLPYRRTSDGGNIVYEAELDTRALSASPLPKLQIGVDQLDTVPGASREFGIAIRRVELLPAARTTGD